MHGAATVENTGRHRACRSRDEPLFHLPLAELARRVVVRKVDLEGIAALALAHTHHNTLVVALGGPHRHGSAPLPRCPPALARRWHAEDIAGHSKPAAHQRLAGIR